MVTINRSDIIPPIQVLSSRAAASMPQTELIENRGDRGSKTTVGSMPCYTVRADASHARANAHNLEG